MGYCAPLRMRGMVQVLAAKANQNSEGLQLSICMRQFLSRFFVYICCHLDGGALLNNFPA